MNQEKPVITEELNGHLIEIFQDSDPENPREWENLGTMTCFHSRYTMGDKHDFSIDGFRDEFLPENEHNMILLPLFLYDHGGLTMSTGSFNDRWDSGQVGYIYVTKEKIRKEYDWKYLTQNRIQKIREYLKQEVETYDQYLTGDIYGFRVEGPYYDDSCCGFYGTKAALEEATNSLTCSIKHHIQDVKETQALEGLEGYLILEEYPTGTAA